METQKREAIFSNDHVIKHERETVNNTLPGMQKILDTYNSFLPDLPELDTNSFRKIFYNVDEAVEGFKEHFYMQKYSEAHLSFGITKDKGMKLIEDSFPDFEAIARAISELWVSNTIKNNVSTVAPTEAYEIEGDKIVISEHYLNQITERHTQYLEFPNEFKVKALLENITENFNQLLDLVPPHVLQIEDHLIPAENTMYFKQIASIFNVAYPRFANEVHPVLKPSPRFYSGLKQGLIATGKQGY